MQTAITNIDRIIFLWLKFKLLYFGNQFLKVTFIVPFFQQIFLDRFLLFTIMVAGSAPDHDLSMKSIYGGVFSSSNHF